MKSLRFYIGFSNITKFNVLAAQKNQVSRLSDKYKIIISDSKLFNRGEAQTFVGEKMEAMLVSEHKAITEEMRSKLIDARNTLQALLRIRMEETIAMAECTINDIDDLLESLKNTNI
jgi:hypothetical protein